MRISVVIAAYHGEKYIGEQLLSLARQTLPPDEVWIGDDSEDGATEEAVKAARLADASRMAVRYLRNTPRRGVLGNFVNLAGLATGDLIFFCDQDDVWLPGKIERLAGLMEESPSIQVAGCNSKVVDSALKPSGRFLYGGICRLERWRRLPSRRILRSWPGHASPFSATTSACGGRSCLSCSARRLIWQASDMTFG